MTTKTTLHYFEEIKEVTKKSFELAIPPANSVHDRPVYRTGDGDYIQPLRPGSQDHKLCQSRGLLASTSS
jgi:hypothetical protein